MNIIFGVRNLSKETGLSVRTIYRYMELGMPYKQISEKKRAFDLESIKQWINGGN